ncbi:MAG: ferrous iron transport protein B [Eubacteriales bacterium]
MGLTHKSTGTSVLSGELDIVKTTPDDKVIALCGNPNVGKSTVFNQLTGLNQHTGNWPGKTVANAQGRYVHQGFNFILVDLPGTYSLMATSVEEEIARDFVCFSSPDTTVIVADATCLERNLNLVLQVIELTDNAILCLNILDEAKKKKININLKKLESSLGIPVVGCSARSGDGLDKLKEEIYLLSHGLKQSIPKKLTYSPPIETAINIIKESLSGIENIDRRFTAIKLLDCDEKYISTINKNLKLNLLNTDKVKTAIKEAKAYLLNENIDKEQVHDLIVFKIANEAEKIYLDCVTLKNENYLNRDKKIDKILTSKLTGIPIMIALLGLIFYITIVGANYPSQLLSSAFSFIQGKLTLFFTSINAPDWVNGILVLGMYRTLAWVVAVMLPPMAIFFPLFTLLEDLGYLPRVAFNMDKFFKKACSHGKQSLTMCMGFGCNACGVIGCRIIESPRERLIAILTNNFVPCNGRFPTLIAIITMFFAGGVAMSFQSVVSTGILTALIIFSILMTLFVSKMLSKTILKGYPSSFALELPPYRRPQIGKILVRSLLDRTLFVLRRAIAVAAPAGLIIWLLANLNVEGVSLLNHCTGFLDPFARLIGLDGVILMAFILGFPANEIVFPIIIMAYMSTGSLTELDSISQLRDLLVANGWTFVTAICTMLFSLMHFPCATTCLTIKKETQSAKWTFLSAAIPTVLGLIICFIVANVFRLLKI